MSAFSPEYLAELEKGADALTECHRRLDSLEQALEEEPTPDTARAAFQHLGWCAESVEVCCGSEFIMPHDADELWTRFLALAQRAGKWGGGVA